MIKLLIKVVMLSSIMLLSSCSSLSKTEDSQNLQVPTTQQAPTQNMGEGTVMGRIITQSPEDRNGLIVYLGDIFIDSKGYVGGFLDKQKAPNAIVNGEDGEFIINNVPPGQYSLIVYEVVLGGKAYTDDTGNVVTVKVEAGETVDLGDIYFSGF